MDGWMEYLKAGMNLYSKPYPTHHGVLTLTDLRGVISGG